MESIQCVEKIREFNRYYANFLGKLDQEIYTSFPLTEARVMFEINNQNGCTSTEVREIVGLDRGYMSRIVQKFEEEDIIFKEKSLDDKRQYLLYLTNYGKEILNSLIENANQEVGKMIQAISNSELNKLVNSMETIESILSKKHSSQLKVSIRKFQPGDAGYVAHLHGKFYEKEYGFGMTFEYYVLDGLAIFLKNKDGGELWVAEVNGEIAGSIAIVKSSNHLAQLRWFILDDKYHGMGIGKKMMETALDFCKIKNFKHIFLWTITTLEAARHLYKKYNFKPTEEKINDEWSIYGTKIIEERWDLDISDENKQK